MRILAGWMVMLVAMTAALGQKKAVTVAADGSGDYRDVQTAMDAAPKTGGLVVRIRPGVYKQALRIDGNGVELRGLGKQPQDVVLTYGTSHDMVASTTKSASTTVSGDDFYAENLTFENSFSKDHPEARGETQAVALLALGDRQVYRHVRLIGAQDTLYANSKTCHGEAEVKAGQPCRAARQLYEDCYIEGHVDFIFGDAKAVFERCEIHAVPHAITTITAQSRVYPAEDSGYLFRDCTVTGAPEATNILLGRPWRAYSTVVFLNTDFKAKLNPEGWAEWDGKLKTSDYAEYGSKGLSGDLRMRLAGTRVLPAEEAAKDTVSGWLSGPDHWDAEAVK